jgi:hypothetical protein
MPKDKHLNNNSSSNDDGQGQENFNVLMIGIDSISRLNLIRSMPETYNFLTRNNWIEMKGYNKIGENTYPNLMAILTGLKLDEAKQKCNWKNECDLEKCRFLWDEFKDANYLTAYAEDYMPLTTFNYYKTGFCKQPTDYYFRPFALAAEDFMRTMFDKSWDYRCLGYRHYADYIYEYALDFAVQNRNRNNSYFGLFWTNSFSHDVLRYKQLNY